MDVSSCLHAESHEFAMQRSLSREERKIRAEMEMFAKLDQDPLPPLKPKTPRAPKVKAGEL